MNTNKEKAVSNNPFDRNKTKEARLGELITEPGEQNQRDAIHIAIVPIKARNNLQPGQRVGVTPDGEWAGTPGGLFSEAVGIVDPYMEQRVLGGQTFWLCLFQGSVHTLRHEWTHPCFPGTVSDKPRISGEQMMAEQRVRAFVAQECSWRTYEEFLDEAKDAVSMGHGIQMGNNESVNTYDELLQDIGILTGIDVSDKEGPWFRCAC